MYVVFENQGEIDPILIRTFGVSVKESASPIGFFGTGLKYALAILLREHQDIAIQSGESVHRFGMMERVMRGETFRLITMDGEPMGFTDQVGKTWETWMAYRELYCNCQDEGGVVYVADEAPEPKAGITRVVVKGERFVEEHSKRSSFILIGDPLVELDGCNVHQGENTGIFYRGMLVHRVPKDMRTRYTYNLTRSVELTEDRTAKHPILFPMYLASSIIGAEDDELLRSLLALPNGYYEHHFDFRESGCWGSPKPTQAFLRVAQDVMRDSAGKMNQTVVHRYRDDTRSKLSPETAPLTGVEKEILKRAVEFCVGMGFEVAEYPIIVTDTLGGDILGMAQDLRIYVSRRAFMQGTKQVAATLIEEFVHLKYGYADESREMQNFLFERLVSMGEELRGMPV